MGEKDAEAKEEKMLRMRVSDLRSGTQKLNLGIPFTFVKLGLSIASSMAPILKNVDTEGLIKAMEGGVSGKVLELEDLEKGHKVEIYIE